MTLYSIDEAFPAELVRSFEGLPCTTRSKTCSMRLTSRCAGVLTSVRVEGRATCVVEYLPPNGGIWSINGMFDEPLQISVSPAVHCTVCRDKETFVSTWSGALEVEAGSVCHVKFEAPEAPSKTVGHHRTNYCTIEVRDVALKFSPAAKTLGGQIAALFDNSAALSAQDAVAVRLRDPSAPRLYVSKFVLQLRSPVFKAELDGPFREAQARELSFEDFPPLAVRSFLEMLHKDEYTGPRLRGEDVVAVYALGDKYDVLFVQDAMRSHLEERRMGAGELHAAFVALDQFRVSALKPVLAKKVRWLGHEELCKVICDSPS